MSSPSSRMVVAGLVSLGLTLQFPVVAAASVLTRDAVQPAGDDMDAVWELIRIGDARVDAAEYGKAIDAYQEALETLSTSPEWASQLNVVRDMLSQAHVGAFGIDNDPTHLRKAKVLLGQYISHLDAGSEDRAAAEQRVADLEAQLAEFEANEQENAEEEEPEEEEPDEGDGVLTADSSSGETSDDGPRKPGQRLMLGGGLVAALGSPTLILTIYGLVKCQREQKRGDQGVIDGLDQASLDEIGEERDRAYTLAVVGGIATAALVGVGLVLVGVGKSKKKKSGMAFAPTLIPHGAGFGISGRF